MIGIVIAFSNSPTRTWEHTAGRRSAGHIIGVAAAVVAAALFALRDLETRNDHCVAQLMKNSYFDLIDQSYYFPQEGFDLQNGYLTFYGLSLFHLIEKHGTPFRLMYLPRIGDQIKKVKNLFARAINKNGYRGGYNYCYCTKCNHFAPVLKAALKQGVDIETSSSYDIDLILQLMAEGDLDNTIKVVHNGYKTDSYLDKIIQLQQAGFTNSITVLDSLPELERLQSRIRPSAKLQRYAVQSRVCTS